MSIDARSARRFISAGIPAVLRSTSSRSVFQSCVTLASTGKRFTGSNVENASYGLTVCAERAALILEKAPEEEPAKQQENPALDSSIPACPVCGSTSIRRERFSLPIALLSFLLFGLPFLLNRKRVICMNCNRKWKTSDLTMKPTGDSSSP
jgi:hypothetical protein